MASTSSRAAFVDRPCPACGGETYLPEDTGIRECAWCEWFAEPTPSDPRQLLLGDPLRMPAPTPQPPSEGTA
jgi:hypothetical protein